MKCEKCGIEILEGTFCENCKNNNQTSEIQNTQFMATQPTPEQIPQQYDPVANLMSEAVDSNINKEKNELENSIPLGDNNEIPATPVNENVVSITPQNNIQTEQPTQTVAPISPETQNTQESSFQMNSQVEQASQTEMQPVVKKKTKTSTIVIIAVSVVLALFIIFFVLPMISATKSTLGMFNQAKANTFVTEVQSLMSDSKTAFMKDALESPGYGIIHTNINSVKKEDSLVKQIESFDKENISYYIELDRNGRYQRVIVFNEEYCYDFNNYSQGLNDFEKTNVSINEVRMRGKSDSQNGCTGEKPQM